MGRVQAPGVAWADVEEWTRPVWAARERAHHARVDALVAGHLARREAGARHPVEDFLWVYYAHRPGQLRRWHPGAGILLRDDDDPRGRRTWRHYRAVGDGAAVDVEAYRAARGDFVRWVAHLMAETARRPATYACFGLHEWAMVYRGGDSAVRHSQVPLRLGHEGTDAVVDSMTLRCTHYDAYRFFTEDAVPRNALALSPESRLGSEQPGCIHASMDLYKWCYKLGPLIDSEFVTDCFELALEARTIDMRASPYDLSEYHLDPIRIETAVGRAEYVRAQGELSEKAAPLRSALVDRCRNLLTGGGFGVGPTAE